MVPALDKDAELLHEGGFLSRLCWNTSRIKVLVPEITSPAGLVVALGDWLGKRVLCPMPTVVDMEEPLVLPHFFEDLEVSGWILVRF
ncbi:putative Uroporphyrinogen-III synthase [Cocos nucifera]|uniref:Putative Uroporphyrinogen-III synthase n=1 Tax=Cocos nucifera TaxID=13894 RepID=A0A8K0IY45_COCNU|nr:putative Uroporphyrinogen-III synthase [Cocos nucifera]